MIIEGEIFKQVKNAGKRKYGKIDLFPYATNLYDVLDSRGIVEEIKNTALLGSITARKSNNYSRFDYIMMQLYIYQFVKKHLNDDLELSLGNKVQFKEFENRVVELSETDFEKIPSIADVLQLLSIIYNMGHFKNTFTSSRAMMNTIKSDEILLENFLLNFEYEKHKEIARNIIDYNNYHRFHLLNSLLMLCNIENNNKIVSFSINILIEYLMPTDKQSQKIQYIFRLFKSIREISFVTLDLSIAPVPIYIDIYNDNHLKVLLKERLSTFNNKKQITNLFQGLSKLLQDTVYNEEVNVLIQYDISRRMTQNASKHSEVKAVMKLDYLEFVKSNSNNAIDIFNKKYSKSMNFDEGNILKISFKHEKQDEIETLIRNLNKISFVKAGWYFRINEDKVTLLVAIKKKCKTKKQVAFKIARLILNFLYNSQNKDQNEHCHNEILLTIKYLLFYMFNEHRVILDGKLDSETCVLLDRGYNQRVKSIEKLLKKTVNENLDDIHEVRVLKEILKSDKKNDIGVTVCSSIVVKDNKDYSKKKVEFDGLILFPNRKDAQVIFVESKNTKEQPAFSKKCLMEKLKKLEIKYTEENMEIFGMNCKYKYNILK